MIVSRYSKIQAEEMLDFLVKTDDLYADSVAEVEYLENKLKQVEATLQLASEERSQEAKKADARSHPEFIEIVDQLKEAIKNRRQVEAKRDTAKTIIMWVQSKMKAENEGRM